ncbi:MAG: hypothetical protein WCX94_02700 [Candidatus Dojkabacteria bacterium]|jgi:hypothetical protein
MTDTPKNEKPNKIGKLLKNIWNFLDGHKTKIGTAIYFANELFGDKLPPTLNVILKTTSEIVIALGWVHYMYKGKNNINKLIKRK